MGRVNIQANYVEEIGIDYAIRDIEGAIQTRKTKALASESFII